MGSGDARGDRYRLVTVEIPIVATGEMSSLQWSATAFIHRASDGTLEGRIERTGFNSRELARRAVVADAEQHIRALDVDATQG